VARREPDAAIVNGETAKVYLDRAVAAALAAPGNGPAGASAHPGKPAPRA